MTALEQVPPLSEKDFLRQVVELAEIRGWQWLHLRPGMTRDSWRTPISGPLGKGWPDLVLVRRSRVVFAELKSEGAKASAEQSAVLQTLGLVGDNVAAHLWWPSDWSEIEAVLR